MSQSLVVLSVTINVLSIVFYSTLFPICIEGIRKANADGDTGLKWIYIACMSTGSVMPFIPFVAIAVLAP